MQQFTSSPTAADSGDPTIHTRHVLLRQERLIEPSAATIPSYDWYALGRKQKTGSDGSVPKQKNPILRRLSKTLWGDHEHFVWGNERFDCLQLNAMNGRLTGHYYPTIAQEGLLLDYHAAGATADFSHHSPLDGGGGDLTTASFPAKILWKNEHTKAVRVGKSATQRGYR